MKNEGKAISGVSTWQYKAVSSVIAAATIAIAGLVYILLNNKADALAKEHLDSIATNISISTVTALQQSVEKLRAIASIVTFSENVTPQQFSKYVEGFTDLDEKTYPLFLNKGGGKGYLFSTHSMTGP